jgi:hypothetical protein
MKTILFIGLIVLSVNLSAQESIPVGTVLPVQLETSLSKKSEPGQLLKARVMQDVPLGKDLKIHVGAKVIGQVVDLVPYDKGTKAKISFRFDRVVVSHQTISITTDLRAMASMMEVDEAQIPETGPDRGTPSTAWTTVQVGGDEVVYRGGGHVMNAAEVVGEPVSDGVMVRVSPNANRGCRGPINGYERSQAVWVFASDACGLYGFSGVTILNSGRSDPVGLIVLTANQKDLNIRGGSGMLLRIISPN